MNFLVGRDGFEPSKQVATDLQSAPFGHSGISPYFVFFFSGVLPENVYNNTTGFFKMQVFFQNFFKFFEKKLLSLPSCPSMAFILFLPPCIWYNII